MRFANWMSSCASAEPSAESGPISWSAHTNTVLSFCPQLGNRSSAFQWLWLQRIHKIFMYWHEESKFSLLQVFTEESKRFSCFHHSFLDVMHQRVENQMWRITLQHVGEENPSVSQTDSDPACLLFPPSPLRRKMGSVSVVTVGWKWLFSQMFCGLAIPHGDGDRGILG